MLSFLGLGVQSNQRTAFYHSQCKKSLALGNYLLCDLDSLENKKLSKGLKMSTKQHMQYHTLLRPVNAFEKK